MSEWQSTKGSGNTWNPTKDENGDQRSEATKDDVLDGYYVGKKEGVGQHNQNVYTIEKKDGTRFEVWGTTVINNEMENIRIGTFIRIQWHGLKLKKASANKKSNQLKSTDYFHDWEIFTSKSEPLWSGSNPVANGAPSSNSTAPRQNKPVVTDEDDLPF